MRVGLVHSGGASPVARAIQAAILCGSSRPRLLAFIQALLKEDEVSEVEVVAMASQHGVNTDKMNEFMYSAQVNSTISQHLLFVQTVLGLREGQNAILSNGKVAISKNHQTILTPTCSFSSLGHFLKGRHSTEMTG